jgi:hypothetical protein
MTDTPDTIDAPPGTVLELDIDSLTLGELALLEREAGQSWATLFSAGPASRRLLALWLHELRMERDPRSTSYAPRPSWRELSNRPARGVFASTSLSFSGGPSPTSND